MGNGSRIAIAIASLLCVLASSRAEAMAIWPPSSGWVEITAGGVGYWDDVGDEHPDATDVVGGLDDGTYYSAGYYMIDDVNDQLLFRIRVDADGTNSKSVWQVLFETDGTASTIDYVLELRQSGKPADQQAIFTSASTGGSTFADVALSSSYEWTGTIPDWTRWIGATDGSTFDDDADYFVDIGMPLSTFQSITGLAHLEVMQLAISSSTSHSGITKDTPLGLSDASGVDQGWGDGIILTPEPSTHLLVTLGLVALGVARSRSPRRSRFASGKV